MQESQPEVAISEDELELISILKLPRARRSTRQLLAMVRGTQSRLFIGIIGRIDGHYRVFIGIMGRIDGHYRVFVGVMGRVDGYYRVLIK